MAVVTSLGITFNTTAGNKTVVATPAVGDLIVIVCANSGRTTAQDPALSDNAGDGGTYVQVTAAESTKNTSADTMWIFVRSKLMETAISTTFTFAPNAGADSGGGLEVFKATGMGKAGLNAIRQAAVQNNQAGSTTPAPAFSLPVDSINAIIGAVFNGTSPATLTAPTGFAESQDTGYSVPTTGIETVRRDSGQTGTTVTWGSATTVYCSSVVELDTYTPTFMRRSIEPPEFLMRRRLPFTYFGGGVIGGAPPAADIYYPDIGGSYYPT